MAAAKVVSGEEVMRVWHDVVDTAMRQNLLFATSLNDTLATRLSLLEGKLDKAVVVWEEGAGVRCVLWICVSVAFVLVAHVLYKWTSEMNAMRAALRARIEYEDGPGRQ